MTTRIAQFILIFTLVIFTLFIFTGNQAMADQKLRRSAAALSGFAGKYDDKEALEEARETEAQADMLEVQGMSKKSRKELRTKSYQMKNQQIEK